MSRATYRMLRRLRRLSFTALAVATACAAPSHATRPEAPPARHATVSEPSLLPGGGTILFPHYRVVAFYGAAGVPGLGVLGVGAPSDAGAKLLSRARAFAAFGRPVLPAFELIATVVQHVPGRSGTYSVHASDAAIGRYLAAARRIHALLILDIQPGYRSFDEDARHYERYLTQRDVGLALDSEWSVRRGEVPGRVIGSTSAASVNAVSKYLAHLVRVHHLPQKMLAIHLFTPEMIANASAIVAHPELAITFHIDGFGARANKRADYARLHRNAPFFNGFKLFLDQDVRMFSPTDVMHFTPQPDLVTYE